MRIDKFLSAVNIVKRRTIAQDMIKEGVVALNDSVAKGSKEVKVGDVITITYLKSTQKFKVLAIPVTKSTPKAQRDKYVKEV
jgi:ribosomal 50S subunit-recycling heat shock protein